MNQSFLTGEADLVELEQQGPLIVLKLTKGGLSGPATRLLLSPKEARTLIMMLATAVEAGPYSRSRKDEDNLVGGCDI